MDPHKYFRIEDDKMIFHNGRVVGTVYQEVDGYYVFVPRGEGCYPASALIQIGQVLQDFNEPWNKEVRDYFESGN